MVVLTLNENFFVKSEKSAFGVRVVENERQGERLLRFQLFFSWNETSLKLTAGVSGIVVSRT